MTDGKDLIRHWQKEYHDAITYFYQDGFIAYVVEYEAVDRPYVEIINVCSLDNGRRLYSEWFRAMEKLGVKYCLGTVDLTLPHYRKLLLLYLYYGAKIIKITENRIMHFRKEIG